MSIGADLAKTLLADLSADGENHDLARWALDFGPAEALAYITGFLHGRYGREHSRTALANAARAIIAGEAGKI